MLRVWSQAAALVVVSWCECQHARVQVMTRRLTCAAHCCGKSWIGVCVKTLFALGGCCHWQLGVLCCAVLPSF